LQFKDLLVTNYLLFWHKRCRRMIPKTIQELMTMAIQFSAGRDILIGIGAGLLGSVVVGPLNSFLSRFVSEQQRRREMAVREGSPHNVAAGKIAKKLGGSEQAKRLSRVAFAAAYGLGWGVIYALVRRAAPPAARFAGLPFGAAFFLLCDGALAPLFRMSPPLQRIPWQPNAKEMINHVAWTVTAELAHRAAEQVYGPRHGRQT
jgi:hypothetical protein